MGSSRLALLHVGVVKILGRLSGIGRIGHGEGLLLLSYICLHRVVGVLDVFMVSPLTVEHAQFWMVINFLFIFPLYARVKQTPEAIILALVFVGRVFAGP